MCSPEGERVRSLATTGDSRPPPAGGDARTAASPRVETMLPASKRTGARRADSSSAGRVRAGTRPREAQRAGRGAVAGRPSRRRPCRWSH